jgi:hypothetical protein
VIYYGFVELGAFEIIILGQKAPSTQSRRFRSDDYDFGRPTAHSPILSASFLVIIIIL